MLFVPMMCCFLQFAAPERRAAGYVAAVFAGMYAAIILLVYFAQLTAVRFGGLTEQARILLDFRQMNLFFSFDLLGYALMSLATFFRGADGLPAEQDRQMAAGAASDPRCVLYQLPADADAGRLSGGQPRVDRHGGAGVLVRLFLPGGRSVAPVLSEDKLKNLPPKGAALWGKVFQSITGRSSP